MIQGYPRVLGIRLNSEQDRSSPPPECSEAEGGLQDPLHLIIPVEAIMLPILPRSQLIRLDLLQELVPALCQSGSPIL